MAQLDQELVRVTALQVVFDLLLKFGLEAFKVSAAVPELDNSDPSTASEEDQSGTEDNEEEAETEQGEADNEKKDDEHDEIPAPDTDTAASVLTILTGILESEVLLTSLAVHQCRQILTTQVRIACILELLLESLHIIRINESYVSAFFPVLGDFECDVTCQYRTRFQAPFRSLG